MPDESRLNELIKTRTSLMVATAKMVAHYVAAAVEAGTPQERINSVLLDIVESTRVSEIYVTDADGSIEFGSHPTLNFTFTYGPGGRNPGSTLCPVAGRHDLRGQRHRGGPGAAAPRTRRPGVPVRGSLRDCPASHCTGGHRG